MNSKMGEKNKISKTIRGELFKGFSIIGIIFVLAAAFVLYKLSVTEDHLNSLVDIQLPEHQASFDLQIGLIRNRAELTGWLITHDIKYKNNITTSWKNINKLITSIDSYMNTNTTYINKWTEAKVTIEQLKIATNRILETPTATPLLIISDIVPITNQLLDILDGPLDAAGARFGGIFDIQHKQLEAYGHEISANILLIRYIQYIIILVCITATILITFVTTRSIINAINIYRKHSENVANGDLTGRILVESNDEMGQLGKDLNSMTESLSTITYQITEACHHMVTTIEEVKHAVDVQSSGASEQASSINEITSSLEEIEKSSTHTIEKAKTLGNIAEVTREKGQLGLDAVEQSIKGMKSVRDKVQTIAQTILDLSNQTQQVGEITSVVNTLAQQSKMLALNASIEAAKAGDAGKGFAVVAAEVKNLAEQSEQSTTQVQKILEDIRHATEKAVMATEEGTKGVDEGTALVEQTGEVVKNLTDVIHETTIASQQIEAAIRQEGIGIEQITAGMNEINQVTGSFVESVKQTTEAISNLATLVKNLKDQIEIYKI